MLGWGSGVPVKPSSPTHICKQTTYDIQVTKTGETLYLTHCDPLPMKNPVNAPDVTNCLPCMFNIYDKICF